MTVKGDLPVWDVARFAAGRDIGRRKQADALLAVLENGGYALLTSTGITAESLLRAAHSATSFFALPQEIKSEYECASGSGQRGYTGFGEPQAIRGHQPDLKEFWQMGRDMDSMPTASRYPENVWPREVADLKVNFCTLFNEADAMCANLMESLDIALNTSARLTASIQRGNSVIRALHYPPIPTVPAAGLPVYRAAPHYDIDLFTIWLGASGRGLQFQDRRGAWHDVEPKSGQTAVASGEMLSYLTSGRIPAVNHRVMNPEAANTSRYSLVFLLHPRPEADLRPLSNGANTAGDQPVLAQHFFEKRIAFWSQSRQ
jgi:isopenicillin N synthase-like dioxygenase